MTQRPLPEELREFSDWVDPLTPVHEVRTQTLERVLAWLREEAKPDKAQGWPHLVDNETVLGKIMNDDIKLPPLPGWCEPGSNIGLMMQEYGRAAVEADQQRRAEALEVPSDEVTYEGGKATWMGMPVRGWRWKAIDKKNPQMFPPDGIVVHFATHWSTGPKDAERLYSENDIRALLSRYGQPAASAIPIPRTKEEYIALLDLAIKLGKELNIAWEDAFSAAGGQPAARAEPWKECRHCGWECRPSKSETGWKPLAALVAQEPVTTTLLRMALERAQEWISGAPHGDNCYLDPDHDLGKHCECGKESVLAHIESALEDCAAPVAAQPSVTPDAIGFADWWHKECLKGGAYSSALAAWKAASKCTRPAHASVPNHLMQRLELHAEDKANTAFARSTMREALEYFASTPPAAGQAQPDTSDYVSCGCGDMYPPGSYEAGYIHGVGQCENCEAGRTHIAAIRDAALEEAAQLIESTNETTTIEAGGETQRHLTLRKIHGNIIGLTWADHIRALKSQPAASAEGK